MEAREEGVFEIVIGEPTDNGKYLSYIKVMCISQHTDSERKGSSFCRWHFSIHFLQCKCLKFDKILIDYVIIGSDDGPAPNKWWVIIWTNDDKVYWRIYAALGLCELNPPKPYSCNIPFVNCNVRLSNHFEVCYTAIFRTQRNRQ